MCNKKEFKIMLRLSELTIIFNQNVMYGEPQVSSYLRPVNYVFTYYFNDEDMNCSEKFINKNYLAYTFILMHKPILCIPRTPTLYIYIYKLIYYLICVKLFLPPPIEPRRYPKNCIFASQLSFSLY